MARDTGIAARLRAAGLRVVEVAGWQTRGSTTFSPRGSVNHHTAGGSSGAAPSLNTCVYGRPGLSGPLANVVQSREPGGNDIAYVVAAGRANHAGSGGWKGLSGNSSVYGLEIEHTGVAPLPEARQRIAARVHAAMFRGDPVMVCQHREWASSRKIDAATGVDPDRFRQWVREYQSGAPAPPTQEDDDLPYTPEQFEEHVRKAVTAVLTTGGHDARTAIRELSKLGTDDAAKPEKGTSPTRQGLAEVIDRQFSTDGTATRSGVHSATKAAVEDAVAARLEAMQAQIDAIAAAVQAQS
jgi:hypothetical protein